MSKVDNLLACMHKKHGFIKPQDVEEDYTNLAKSVGVDVTGMNQEQMKEAYLTKLDEE